MIKLIAMDVDGTLTDGKIYLFNDGNEAKAFSSKDGYGIKKAVKKGIIIAIITGRTSHIVTKRMEELKVKEVYQGIDDKVECLKSLVEKYHLSYDEVAYIGDDQNDEECLKLCGIKACPKDAFESTIKMCNFVAPHKGGFGAVRDVIEFVLKD